MKQVSEQKGVAKMIYYLIAIVTVIVDQLTKWLIVKYMKLGESIPVIDGFLSITSHRNRGAAWGILEGQMAFFVIITVLVIVGIVYYMKSFASQSKVYGWGLGLLLGGAIGNFIDRLFRGEVVDFVDTIIFGYDFPIFNVADSALCIGVGLIIFQMFKEEFVAKKKARG